MIFYFTGTGKSLYAAKALANADEEVVSIIDAMRSKSFHYVLKENEPLGFVFPVYFYTVSDPVLDFIRNLDVENAGFVYAVIVCGGNIGPAGGFLKDELKKRGLNLQRVDALLVPDGALIFYDIDPPEKMQEKLEHASTELISIKSAVNSCTPNRITGNAALGRVGLAGYHACMSTKKFYADDKCVHCGKCADFCPAEAIMMVDGRPKWVKDKCLKCCGCINRCPVSAIQYGKRTVSRGRYVNPILQEGQKTN